MRLQLRKPRSALLTVRGVAALLTAATLQSSFAMADHPGGAGSGLGVGPAITIPATTLSRGQFAPFLLHEHIGMQTLSNQQLIDAAARHEHVHSVSSVQSISLGAAYGVTEDLTISLRLPFVRRTDIREGAHEHGPGGVAINSVDQRGDASGVSDLLLFGEWRFLKKPVAAVEAALLAGVELPSGQTDVRDRSGRLFETEFQPGSGSTDPLIGLALTRQFGPWSLDGNILHQFATTGAQRTNLGDRFGYNAALSYRLFGYSAADAEPGHTHSLKEHVHVHDDGHVHVHEPEQPPSSTFTLDGIVELNGRWEGQERVAGVRDPNTGGNVVYLSPGLRASYGNMSRFVSVGVPIVNNPNGLQSKPAFRVASGITLSF
jgi:hypothetical protein